MKKRILSLLMVLAMLCTLLPSGMLMASAAETVNIVCVGDSITAGSHSSGNGYNYPDRLGQILGGDYKVIGKGVGGRTMGVFNSQQYTYQDNAGNKIGVDNNAQANSYVDNATIASADYVIIMLGTNDGEYWTMTEGVPDADAVKNYTESYKNMIDTFRTINPEIKIIMATPPTSKTGTTGRWSEERLASVSGVVKDLYEEYVVDSPDNFRFIDIHALTSDHTVWDKLLYDEVHYTDNGYMELARQFYNEFWNADVASFEVEGCDTKVDNTMATLYVAGDVTDKIGVLTVAKSASADVAVELVDGQPITVTAAEGNTKTYTLRVTEDKADFDKNLIYTADQFKALQGKDLEGDYKLMADIDLGTVTWNPIASLTGSFDGNGHTVTMAGTVPANNYGLFGQIKADSVLKNITLAGTLDANGKVCVAGLAYENHGLMQDCINTATISGGGNGDYAAYRTSVAGLTSVNYGVMNQCANTGDITGRGNYVTGVAGSLAGSGVVVNCYNTGAITVTGAEGLDGNGAAGIVSIVDAAAVTTAIVNCYNTGAITSGNNGQLIAGILSNGNNGGGTVLQNVWNTGAIVTTSGSRHEICTRNLKVTMSKYYTSTANVTDALAALNGNLLEGVYSGEDLYSLYSWVEGPAFGELVTAMPQDADGTYHLMNRDHFDWWNEAVRADASIKAKLECDITLTGEWTPIPNLTGTFDGGNHTISGLTISATTSNNQGFFARINGGTVKNLNLANVSVTATHANVGAVVGSLIYGTVSGCSVSGSLSATYNGNINLGGLIGAAGQDNQPVLIENCVNNAALTIAHTATNDVNVGGIVGRMFNAKPGSVIRGCINYGAITGQNDAAVQSKKVAGIAGETYVSIVNCENHGAITGYNDIGGIVGVSYNGNDTTIDGNYDIQVYIANNYNTGTITAGNNNRGGISGRFNMYSEAYNNYTIGNIKVTNQFNNTGSATNSQQAPTNYYLNTATTNGYGTAKTEAEMQSANFVRTLNNFVIAEKDDEAFGWLGMTKWEKGEDNYPVLTAKLPTDTDVVDDSNLIETVAQLLAMSGSNSKFTLANDLTVTATDVAGNSNLYILNGFGGTFNGDGHTITIECNRYLFNAINQNGVVKNLVINGTIDFGESTEVAGIVKDLYGTIDNVEFAGSIVTTKARLGGFAMNMWQGATIRNSVFSGSVTALDSVAGFVARSYGNNSAPILMENCVTTATARVEATSSGTVNLAGILWAAQTNITLRNCVNNATLVAANTAGNRDNIGGIVATVQSNSAFKAVIDGCTNSGTIGAGNATGGIVGHIEGANATLIVTNCQNTGAITGLNYTGAIVGRAQSGMKLYVINCANTGTVAGNGNAIVGVLRNNGAVGYVYNCYSTKSGWGAVGTQGTAGTDYTLYQDNQYMPYTGGTSVDTMKTAGFVLELDSYKADDAVQAVLTENNITLRTWDQVVGATPVLGEAAIGAKGGINYDADGAFLISNNLQMEYFAILVKSNPNLSAKLTADVVLNADWTRMEVNYAGTFDGCGYTVSGFKQENTSYPGFFKAIAAAGAVKNLTLQGSLFAPNQSGFGALVVENYGRVENVTNKVDIVNPEKKRDANGRIDADMQGGKENIGGIVGQNKSGGVVDSCRNEALLVSNADRLGGIVGYTNNNTVIVNCVNTGEVVHVGASSGTGGIAGGTASASDTVYIMNCINLGDVYDNNAHRGYIGGIMGDATGSGVNSYVINSYHAGTIYYKGNASGGQGIGGRGINVVDCYSAITSTVNNDVKNGTKMALADMQTLAFADTLNANIDNLDETYKAVLDAAGVSLKYWTQTEGELPVHNNGVTVTFTIKNGEKLATALATSSTMLKDLLTNTKAPTLGGYEFKNWDHLPDQADLLFNSFANSTLTVLALYEVTTVPAYTVEIINGSAVAGGDVVVESNVTKLSFDQRVTVTAEELPGQTFSYWLLNGAKVGFGKATYTFYMGGNSTVEAVYDAAVDTLTPEAVVQQATYSLNGDRFTLSVIAQTSIPNEVEGLTFGVIYAAKESIITGDDLLGQTNIVNVVSSKSDANSQYMTHLLSVAQNRTRYARAYVQYTLNGVTVTEYSAQYVLFQTATDDATAEIFSVPQ